MLYAFGDESYPDGTGGRVAAYLVIAVLQENYARKAPYLRSAFRKSGKKRQHAIVRALRNIGAIIVLGRAEIPAHLETVKAVEEPSTGRVPLKAALWAWTSGFTCSTALLTAIRSGIVFSCVDFYYDPQDLATSYREYIESTMRRKFQEQLAEYSSLRFGPNAARPVLRRIMPVPKSPTPYSPQHVQLGVSCADELLTFALKCPGEAAEFMEFRDFSSTVAMMLAGGEIVTEASAGVSPNTGDAADT
jgi:hypothetical protein